jgi:mannose-6-phosphate isomerase class I
LSNAQTYLCEKTKGPEIHLVLDGTLNLNSELEVKRGECVFFPARSSYQYVGNGLVCRAGVA